MQQRIIQLKREQSIVNIYDENDGVIEEDDIPDIDIIKCSDLIQRHPNGRKAQPVD